MSESTNNAETSLNQEKSQLSAKERRKQTRQHQPANKVNKPSTPQERLEARKNKARQRAAYRANLRKRNAAKSLPASVAVSVSNLDNELASTAGRKKVRQGIVISDKAEKTVVVRIDMARRHPRYERIVRFSRKLYVHDEQNEAREGDTVSIIESRPLSRTKRWRLQNIVERAK